MPVGSESPITDAPRWQLESIYPGFDSEEYSSAQRELAELSASLQGMLIDGSAESGGIAWLERVLSAFDAAYGLYRNLEGYVYCAFSVNTRDARTVRELNGLEKAALPLKDAEVRFRNELRTVAGLLPEWVGRSESCSRFQFFLDEQLKLAERQMSVPEENLASDLMRAGGDAWGRLQDTILSNLSWPWDGDERKTVVELRSLAMNPDRGIREKAYTKELEAWKSMEIPIAAALNGVKGFTVTLDKRRSYESSIDHATRLSRISQATLDALVASIETNLQLFRRYLKAKAAMLGIARCAFYDLFAPVGSTDRTFSFAEASDFVVTQFAGFSAELGDFGRNAVARGWMDAEPRPGKTGGAYCQFLPVARESRVLLNFDGTFDSLFTMAHELGHGYHGLVLKDLPHLLQDYPMTTAETASIFCETIVFNGAMSKATEAEKLAILETYLQGATQVLVDILSRYQFESAVFERRSNGELSPDELCGLMLEAQRATYGDGLDEEKLHPYMWAVKPHYYSPEQAFYNFPYAFGLLFGLALYAQYQEQPDGFADRYRALLELTGQATANDVTKQAGFDIESLEFWQSGIDIIGDRVSEFESLVRRTGK
jgi:oligoendopeptidase F